MTVAPMLGLNIMNVCISGARWHNNDLCSAFCDVLYEAMDMFVPSVET